MWVGCLTENVDDLFSENPPQEITQNKTSHSTIDHLKVLI
jgi:hypothetical protein